ncbi:MAG: 5-formyltetrahydrofolate cyclo-ligase [Rhodobacter sp.]|nr:5-formyltetrahydrofolate cyclo-ligase [Rhodobacter sp.]
MSEAKAAARKAAFARRKAAHGAGLDRAAQEALSAALAPYRGRMLAGYMPIRTEIDPLPVMAAWDAPVGVPVIEGAGKPLVFHRWAPGCAMTDGPFGARIPAEAVPMVPEVLIVPLVAFDRRGYRLGYGGGFYDRTLERLRAAQDTVAIGFAYAAQEDDALPVEPTDQPLDAIVTEAGPLQFR